MSSIYLDLWESIDKYLGIEANGRATYTAVISKIQQVRQSAICNLVNDLRKIYSIKEPGQDIDTFRSQVIEKTRRVIGSGSAPNDITSISAQCFIGCDVLD